MGPLQYSRRPTPGQGFSCAAPIRTAAAVACSRAVSAGSASRPQARYCSPACQRAARALATLAGRSALPRHRTWQATAACPKSTLSPAAASALCPDRLGRAGARGPAPSHHSARFFGMSLRPPRLLPTFRPIPALPISTSVRRPAVRLYVASASVTSDAWSAVAAAHDPGAFVFAHRRELRRECRHLFFSLRHRVIVTPDPNSRGGSGRGGPSPSPRFLSLIGEQRRSHACRTGKQARYGCCPWTPSVSSQHYRRYRLPDAEAETAMARSLER